MNNWHSIDINEVYTYTGSNRDGLSSSKAKERLEKYGRNSLPEQKKESFLKIFLTQFYSPIVIVMIFASIISFVVGELVDGFAILFIVFVDAFLGTIQERHAANEADSLKSLIEVKTKVIRDGKEKVINSHELVVGDIVLIESGDKISGDLRIIEATNLTIDESILTGESVAASKGEGVVLSSTILSDRINMAYGGTSVVTGRAKCIVVETGINTEIGKISSKVNETKSEKSPLTIRIEKLSKQITLLVLVVAILITLVMILNGEELQNVFISVVALSVSAMPEGLPLALTLALTIGSQRMAKKNVIVKKLNSVESLGSCTVIASDKTGTLTLNQQTAKKIILADGSTYDVEGIGYNGEGKVLEVNGSDINNAMKIAKLGVINNEARLEKVNDKWTSHGDSIDIAFLALGEKLNIGSSYQVLREIPYESEKKYSAVFYKEEDNIFCTIKGSLEVVLSFCDSMYSEGKISSLNIEQIVKQNDSLACEGFRVIAIAKSRKLSEVPKEKELDDMCIPKMVFVGLVAFIDPIREETKDSINKCKKAGIKVVMITGDHPLTAFSIAKDLNLCDSLDNVATGDDIDKYFAMGIKDFDKFIKEKKVFTRVTPLQKLEIVNSFKRQGEYVAVTGDGVNDAPAIKSANIGIAMGSGTDVAKETSKMIIVDDDFMSIVSGIEEGRNAYSNIRKVVYLLLSCGLSEVFFFALSIFLGLPVPLIAVQLLWLNIVTDGLQDISLSFEREEKEIMNEKPRNPKESIFDKLMFQEVLIAGLTMGLSVLILWLYLVKVRNLELPLARGYVMMLMVFMQNLHALNCRSEKVSAFKLPISRNWFIVFSVVTSIALQIFVMENSFASGLLGTQKVPFVEILVVFLCSIPILLVMEIFKALKYKRR